jgi:hypothetical protein
VHSLLIGLPIALFARGAVLGSVSLGK